MPFDLTQLPASGTTSQAIRNIYASDSVVSKDIQKVLDKFYDCRDGGFNSTELKSIKKDTQELLVKHQSSLSSEQKELLGDILSQANQSRFR